MPQYFVSFASSLKINALVGAYMASACSIGNISSKIIIGYLGDRIGIIKTTLILLSTCLLALLALSLFNNVTILIISTFIYGAMFGIGSVGTSLLTKYFFKEENYQIVYPKVSFFLNLSLAFSATLIGYLYDFLKTYRSIFNLCAILVIIIIILLIYLDKKVSKASH